MTSFFNKDALLDEDFQKFGQVNNTFGNTSFLKTLEDKNASRSFTKLDPIKVNEDYSNSR